MVEDRQQHEFLGVTGFRAAVPPDRPELLLLEFKTANGDIARFSMAKEDALIFGQHLTKVASPPT